MTKQQSYSMENYLEMIAMLGREKDIVRVTQLSTALGVRKSSVSAALTKLSTEGLVKHEKYGYIELTPEGEKMASDILHRHEILEQFFVKILGVDQGIAWKDACDMEHYISPATIQKLTKFVEYVLSRSAKSSGLFHWQSNNLENSIFNENLLTRTGTTGKSNA